MARNLRIASVVVDLVANSARYIAGLREANRDTQRYTRSMQQSLSNMTRNVCWHGGRLSELYRCH